MNGANTLTDVPQDQVGKEVQRCVNFGAIRIELWRQPDGNWTIQILEQG